MIHNFGTFSSKIGLKNSESLFEKSGNIEFFQKFWFWKLNKHQKYLTIIANAPPQLYVIQL